MLDEVSQKKSKKAEVMKPNGKIQSNECFRRSKSSNFIRNQEKMSKTMEPSIVKTKRKNQSDLGDSYVAPDGGWGWVVCIAFGFCNVSNGN